MNSTFLLLQVYTTARQFTTIVHFTTNLSPPESESLLKEKEKEKNQIYISFTVIVGIPFPTFIFPSSPHLLVALALLTSFNN
jgi:hypothetical protein